MSLATTNEENSLTTYKLLTMPKFYHKISSESSQYLGSHQLNMFSTKTKGQTYPRPYNEHRTYNVGLVYQLLFKKQIGYLRMYSKDHRHPSKF